MPAPATLVSLSDVLTALSRALDLTEGQPAGHTLRSCLVAGRLGQELGLGADERSALHYAVLLKDAGCSSNAARFAALFGSDDQEAKELRSDSAKAGCCPIAEAGDRDRVELQGSLRTVTLRPRGGVPALEAELYDGTALLLLVWLGRRRIAGIEPGRAIKVIGRVGVQDKQRIMFNPRYELK